MSNDAEKTMKELRDKCEVDDCEVCDMIDTTQMKEAREQYKDAIGKNTDHFDSLREALANVKAGMDACKDKDELAAWMKTLDDAMQKFILTHTLYFNQRWYAEFKGGDKDLAEVLGVDLLKEGDQDGEDSE